MEARPLRRESTVNRIVLKALRPLSFVQVRRISAARRDDGDARVAGIYQEMERVFGVISPPVALHSPAPDMLAASWMLLYETLLVPGKVDRAAKEAVATAVSKGNACPYCVTVHGAMMQGLDRRKEAAAIADDRIEQIDDPTVRAISSWAKASASPETAAGHEPPFPAEHASEIVGVALVFHYFNRMVNVFLPDAPLPPGVPAAALGAVVPVLSRLMRSAYRNAAPPGATLDLLPEATHLLEPQLSPKLWWAADNPHIAQALARACAAVEAAGRRAVPTAVRELVLAELEAWDGRPKGPSRAWVEQAIRGLPADQQPAGRLALLIALASYQVDETAVAAFQAGDRTDATVVELASWASLTAAVHATTWTSIPRPAARTGL